MNYWLSALDIEGIRVTWKAIISKSEAAGYACRPSHNNIFVWRLGKSTVIQDGFKLIPGLLLHKWSSPHKEKTRIVISLRIEPDKRPASDNEEKRAEDAVKKLYFAQRITELSDCQQFIQAMVEVNRDCVLVEPVEFGKLESVAKVQIAGADYFLTLKEYGWQSLRSRSDRTQIDTRFVIVSQYNDEVKLKLFAKRIVRSMREVCYEADVRVADFFKALAWLKHHPTESDHLDRVFLIGVTGVSGDPIQSQTKELLDLCDHHRIPYRIFSDQSLVNRFALNDQIPHLLRLSGKIPSQLKLGKIWEQTTFIGFDLGHPKNARYSVLTMSVVSSNGNLLGYWRTNQERDETIRMEFMREANEFYQRLIRARNLRPEKIVIFRDGRIFKNDGLRKFMKLLGQQSSLLEIVKRPVPHFWVNEQDATPGSYWVLEDQRDALLQTTSPTARNQSAKAIRIRLLEEAYGSPLNAYLELVYSLCHAPALGLRTTRVPAPVYWSDGLARNGGHDLQFSGLHHVLHKDTLDPAG